MPHLDAYPFKVSIPLPTDEELGTKAATFLKEYGSNYKDGRMMLGAGSLGEPIINLARAMFRVEGVDPKLRQFINLRICKLLGGVNPWGPNLRMLDNLGATEAEKEGIQNDGPVTGVDDEAQLIVKATEELTMDGAISDATLQQMLDRYSAEVCRKYIAVMCWYNWFNRFLISTRVPPETDQEVIDKVGDKTMPA